MSYPVVYKRSGSECACGGNHQQCRCGTAIPLNLPHFDPDISNFLEQYGKNIVYDDRHDIFKLITRKHPHLGHHWISGSFMVVLGQMGQIMSKIGIFMQEFSERENREQPLAYVMRDFIEGMSQELPPHLEESYHAMKKGVKAERAIPLEQYKVEMGTEPVAESKKPLLRAPTPPLLRKDV